MAVHPRERGERISIFIIASNSDGSSPRARGTAGMDGAALKARRFIPASAGNGPPASAHPRSASVHPRERGERKRACCSMGTTAGSSPRARGTAQRGEPLGEVIRFIPASAGNGPGGPCIPSSTAVHPRERGERFLCPPRPSVWGGSSPRARGTGQGVGQILDRGRFIPASAGNGRPWWRRSGAGSVHPRERGERHCITADPGDMGGSSPRARGTEPVE